MDLNSAIEKITREVLSKLQTSNLNISAPSYSGGGGRKNILVILTGSDCKLSNVLSYLTSLSSGNDLTFLISKTAEKIIGTSKIQSAVSNSKII